jgi:hypothetical protein
LNFQPYRLRRADRNCDHIIPTTDPIVFVTAVKMASTETHELGWIGLGSMGLAMATNIQKHLRKIGSPALHYTNRTLSRGDPLKEIGGIPSESIGELVQISGVIFISVRIPSQKGPRATIANKQ